LIKIHTDRLKKKLIKIVSLLLAGFVIYRRRKNNECRGLVSKNLGKKDLWYFFVGCGVADGGWLVFGGLSLLPKGDVKRFPLNKGDDVD
jgi:hypothetical protein